MRFHLCARENLLPLASFTISPVTVALSIPLAHTRRLLLSSLPIMDVSIATPERLAVHSRSNSNIHYHDLRIAEPDCFNQPQNGLGLYLTHEQQAQTPASLSTSMPNTPASWSGNIISQGVALQPPDEKFSLWNSPLQDFNDISANGMGWNESMPMDLPDAQAVHQIASPMPLHSLAVLVSTDLPSRRSSISSRYFSESEGAQLDGNPQSIDMSRLDNDSFWYDNMQSGTTSGVSAPMETVSNGMKDISLLPSSTSESYHLDSYPYARSRSELGSSSMRESTGNAFPDDKIVRTNSLPNTRSDGDQDLYEQSVQQVARTRKRRRLTTASEANHVCDICGRGFSRNSNLTNHLITHSPDRLKAWRCEWAGCDRNFSRRTDMVRHQKSVSLMKHFEA